MEAAGNRDRRSGYLIVCTGNRRPQRVPDDRGPTEGQYFERCYPAPAAVRVSIAQKPLCADALDQFAGDGDAGDARQRIPQGTRHRPPGSVFNQSSKPFVL